MKITVDQKEKVKITFQGKINMSQEITLDSDDAKKLAELLLKKESSSFETK